MCTAFDLAPIPLLGNICTLRLGLKNSNWFDTGIGLVFGAMEVVTLGVGHYASTAAKAVSTLGKTVQKGGKIVRGVIVGGK